ncbi:hypothetical protein, partial [Actinomadura sp. KC345]|uniref:hypothetical protein n=1 Tax=Actinomadura sp. KC345 TaxID=2530371 RepID=UPI001A9D4033
KDPQAAAAAAKIKPTPGAGDGGEPAGGEAEGTGPAGTAPNGDMRPVSDGADGPSPRWLPLLPPVLGGVIILAAAFNTLRALVRRRIR